MSNEDPLKSEKEVAYYANQFGLSGILKKFSF